MSPYYADTMHWQPLGYPALYIIISIMIIIIKVATVMVTSRQHCHVLPPCVSLLSILNIHHWACMSSQNVLLLPSHGGSTTPSNKWFLGPHTPTFQMAF